MKFILRICEGKICTTKTPSEKPNRIDTVLTMVFFITKENKT